MFRTLWFDFKSIFKEPSNEDSIKLSIIHHFDNVPEGHKEWFKFNVKSGSILTLDLIIQYTGKYVTKDGEIVYTFKSSNGYNSFKLVDDDYTPFYLYSDMSSIDKCVVMSIENVMPPKSFHDY